MADDPLQRIEEIFHQAADLEASAREAFLQERYAAEPAEILDRVRALLQRMDSVSLAPPVLGDESRAPEGPGSRIDRYKLLERIGEGGFGVVYMAEQQEPVVRRVALKVIKQGMDTREVVARFEAERQALALMDHPSIARVLDGGATEAGRPYFVMELVRGTPITEFCDRNQLAPRERLELFAEVCQAIQHAHQKGVIHRDIKPSNVLVTLGDGRAVPKVIDFGIAKAMHTRLTDKTLFTRFQQFVGTPAYMSPEQAEMSAVDVDTRSDIYSLGVLLYELLTGSTPFDTRSLFEAGLAEMQRVIREQPPERPSLRISTAGDASVARSRRLDVASLSRQLRGDLDWIVLKALEKERRLRYSSASEFAEDLRRHLNSEPVLAGPPSPLYRLRKFVVRNRTLMTSAAIVLLALIFGVVGTSLGMLQASQQRDAARKEAQNVLQVTDFLIRLLSLADPQFALAPDVSVRSLLDRAAEDVKGAFREQPEAEARVRSAIGRAYLSLGEHPSAAAHLERSVELMDQLAEPDHLELYTALWALTNVSFKLERSDAFVWAGRARRVGLDHIHRSHPQLADSLDAFHAVIEKSAHRADAEPLRRAAEMAPGCLQRADAVLPHGDPLWIIVAETFMDSGYWLWYTPHEQIGAGFFETALRILERERGTGHPSTAEALAMLVGILNRSGRLIDAEQELRQSVERLQQLLAPDNFQRAFVEAMLGDTLRHLGRFEEAEQLLLPAHAVLVAHVPRPTDFYAIDSFARLIDLYDSWGRPEASAPYRETFTRLWATAPSFGAWPLARKCFDAENREILALADQLHEAFGGVSYSLERPLVAPAEFQQPIRRLIELRRARLDAGEPLAAVLARLCLQITYGMTADPGGLSLALADDAWRVLREHATALPGEAAAAAARVAARSPGGAEPRETLARTAIRLLDQADRPSNWFTGVFDAQIACDLLACGQVEDARRLLHAAHDIVALQLGHDHREASLIEALLERARSSP